MRRGTLRCTETASIRRCRATRCWRPSCRPRLPKRWLRLRSVAAVRDVTVRPALIDMRRSCASPTCRPTGVSMDKVAAAVIAGFVLMSAGLARPGDLAEPAASGPPQFPGSDPIRALVERLDLEAYESTIEGLTRFGDRRQGTDRNRAAIDWIEAQLRSYGCTNISRLKYTYFPTDAPRPSGPPVAGADMSVGGARYRGVRTHTGVNIDPKLQPDEKLRTLNSQPSEGGAREEVYCTKTGTAHPEEMYIVGAHMDGHGWGEAANDDGSGTALVMELARILSAPDVKTERSIRFVLWNNEETGLNGAWAYVAQRAALQGKEEPAGSGRYPEPKWLGMIQHDMMLFDHGMPRPDGSVAKEQRPEADRSEEHTSELQSHV